MTEEPTVRDLLQGPSLQTALLQVREVRALLQDSSQPAVPDHLQDSSQREVRALQQDNSHPLEVPVHLQGSSHPLEVPDHLQGNSHPLVVHVLLQDSSHPLEVPDHLQGNSHLHDPPVAIPVHPVLHLNLQVALPAVIQEVVAGQWVVVAIQEVEEVAGQWEVAVVEEVVEAEEGDEYQ